MNRDLRMAADLAAGLSHADICQACDDAAKDAVLKDSKTIEMEALRDALAQRQYRRSFKHECRERN